MTYVPAITGYGATEVCGLGTWSQTKDVTYGSVGMVMPNITLKVNIYNLENKCHLTRDVTAPWLGKELNGWQCQGAYI